MIYKNIKSNIIRGIILLCITCSYNNLKAQILTQTIKGSVIDKQSKIPLSGSYIVLLDSGNFKGTVAGLDGKFKLELVPVGRRTVRVTFLGYLEKTATVILSSGKEAVINIELEESVIEGKEVVITASEDKTQTNNKMTSVSSRSFTIEETSRYAGSRNDPSRMAANYAGVSGANDARNDIIIRGNSPQGILWRLNGIDIPNPNHFGSTGTTGGPVSILNNNLLDQSDFLTGAFPADYGNVLAGVFDLKMRNGNSDKREFLGQVGFNGFELGAEGPLSKAKKSSYLINYRYSTLGVFDALKIDIGTGSAIPQYQDLSFNINIPTEKAGKFSLFGIGGKSYVEMLDSKKDTTKTNFFSIGAKDVYYGSNTGVIGGSHLFLFKNNTYSKASIALSGFSTPNKVENVNRINNQIIITPFYRQEFVQKKCSFNYLINKKFNSKNNLSTGIISDIYFITYRDSIVYAHTDNFVKLRDYSGNTILNQAYSQWQHKFTNLITLNAGIHFQSFSLNKSYSVEPRLGLKWQLNEKQSLSFGSGFHSQMQPLYIYFSGTKLTDGSYLQTNKNLDFTRSKHFVLAYDNQFSQYFRLKGEAYYQLISSVPISNKDQQFSMLNSGADFNTPNIDSLLNDGTGKNYGVEITLEKFYSKGYYFLFTNSLFQSKYTARDYVLRNTAFNGNYVVNALYGKEFKIKDNHTLAFDLKLTNAGGKRYIPIDTEASIIKGEPVYIKQKAFEPQYKDYFRCDFKITYRLNGKRVTQEWLLDIQNITDNKNIFTQQFDPQTGSVKEVYQLGIFFFPQYRILF